MYLLRKSRRLILVLLSLLAVFTVTGFFIVPPIVKVQLERRLSAELGRSVTVGHVRVNPYALSVTLEDFAIRESDGKTLFLGWHRLYVNVDALSSLWGEWVVSDIELDGLSLRGRINADHSLNVSDLLARFIPPAPPAGSPAAKAPPAAPGRPVRIGRLQVTDARIDFADASRPLPFATLIGPVSFVLTDFVTVSEQGAPYHFLAVSEAGEKFEWSGSLRAAPFRSVGELRIENLALTKYAPYYSDLVPADLASGRLTLGGRYEIDLAEKHTVMKLTEGSLHLRDFVLTEKSKGPAAVEIAALDVTGIQADALARKAAVTAFVLTRGGVHVRREADGSLNLLTMLVPYARPAAPTPAAVPAAPSAPAPRPEVMIGEVALKDFAVEVTDLAAPRPAHLALQSLQFSLKQVTLAENAEMPLSLAFDWAPQGTVRLDGRVGLFPVKADLKLAVADLQLLPLSPYIEQFVNARLTQGSVSTTLGISAALPAGQPPALTVAGDVSVDRLGLVDGLRNEPLAGFGRLALHGLHATTAPELSVTLEEINLSAPTAFAVVNADKSLNFAALAKTAPASAAPAAAAPAVNVPPPAGATVPAAARPKLEIGRVVISEGDFRFTDRSVEPNVAVAVNQFGGSVTGLSASNPTKAVVDLSAAVAGAGPIAITGRLDPLGATPTMDLKIAVKNVDLLPLSPYSGKYAGYELARGKLFLDVAFRLDGKAIESTNVLTLQQFTFGNAVNSPDATGLPVRLGVALLKDTDGKIVIDLPVQGRTDDPDFKIGRVVLRVIVNLLTKAAVSPFSLLGSAFGGGGDELAYEEFAPDATDLAPSETKKLDTLVKALTNRPGLNVSLEGGYDAASDGYALKRVKLAARVRRAIWEAKHAVDPNIAPPEQLTVSTEENAAMIRKLFDAQFPPGTRFGAPLAPPPVVTVPPVAAKPGIFRRVLRVVTLAPLRERRHAAAAATSAPAAKSAAAPVIVGPAAPAPAATAPALPLEEMTGRLADATPVDDNELQALAQTRAERVRDYFINVGKIAAERLFLTKSTSPAITKTGKGPRVFLQLQ